MSIYNDEKWLEKPLHERLEELRLINCTGPCGSSNNVIRKRDFENATLKQAINFIKWSTSFVAGVIADDMLGTVGDTPSLENKPYIIDPSYKCERKSIYE